ncbi:ABC1 domain containing protein [Stagonosporopsis vannaccii]|nr:ABC1 domain containing protein [Stagonosporopsis vannaccii]
MDIPSSLSRDISPPRALKRRTLLKAHSPLPETHPYYDAKNDPTLAAVEAGRAKIENHLKYFKHHLAKASRSTTPDVPRLPINVFAAVYKDNQHQHGHHFVIQQHNHPQAGVHYDLRLQFSATSSVSWAFPKGLPGNPNSRQLGRMAIETRVHNLWNNLIESASTKTGSLLIWDIGTYSILPDKKGRKEMPSPQTTDDESDDDVRDVRRHGDIRHENEKLAIAFKSRHIRLRLHGTRLPEDYTITLRLPSNNDMNNKPAVRRKRPRPSASERRPSHTPDSDMTPATAAKTRQPTTATTPTRDEAGVNDLDTDSEEDALTRSQNAYPGSTNSIGSVHQRRWFVLLDRWSSGFEYRNGTWSRRMLPNGELGGFNPFVVRGREHERSIITGRLARDIESDEGCGGYVGRGGWKGIEN